jgi:hypothetical protein
VVNFFTVIWHQSGTLLEYHLQIIFLKSSSKGVVNEKELDEILQSLGLNVFKELGVTKIE